MMAIVEDRLRLFPDTTTIDRDELRIGGHSLSSLAERFGTPLYIYDRATMDASAGKYRDSLKRHYPGNSSVTYAGKAFLCRAIARWVNQQRLWLDCTGETEMAVARAGGLNAASLIVHGTNKSTADLEYALRQAGTIAVDNLSELNRIASIFRSMGQSQFSGQPFPELWLRLQPGLAVATHHVYTQTGQADSKFGMTAEEIIEALRIGRSAGLHITGLHFHQGSNFRNPDPLVPAIELALDLAKEAGFEGAWHFCPGGGWGIAYHEEELPHPDVDLYVRVIARHVLRSCRANGLSLPILHLEPGRSLAARAGVAIYRVGAIKRRGRRTWLLADGGLADNPRPALYGAKYSCLPAAGLGRELGESVSIAGPYCESGDVMIEGLRLPRMQEGELIAVPVSGAYHLSMSSNYNGARRPAVVWLERSQARLIIRRETLADLSQRDLPFA